MNHWGQAPSVLRRLQDTKQQVANRLGVAEASSISSGPLQTSRVPQPPPEYCWSPRGDR